MPSYLVESYSVNRVDAITDAVGRARRTAELGSGVRYVRTTFLPGDETLLHVFEAASPEALGRAARRAKLAYERIVEAVEDSLSGLALEPETDFAELDFGGLES